MLGAKHDALPGNIGTAGAAPIGEDEDFVGAKGFEFAENIGAQAGEHGDDSRDRGDADDDADGGERGADLVGPDLAEREHDALVDEDQQDEGEADYCHAGPLSFVGIAGSASGGRVADGPGVCRPTSRSEGRSETILPSFMRIIRRAWRATSASWVTMMMVCPER